MIIKFLRIAYILMSTVIIAEPALFTLSESDEPIHYWLSLPSDNKQYSLILNLLDGSAMISRYRSHCTLEKWINTSAFGIISVEKPGITNTCINSEKYLQQNSITQQVENIKKVIQSLAIKNWDGFIIVLGASEGAMSGALVAAAHANLTKAAILIAGVGSRNFTLYKEADILIERNCNTLYLGMFIKFFLKNYFKLGMWYAHSFPDSTLKFFGQTAKFWISFEQAMNDIHNKLEAINVPLYIVHGKYDLMALYDSAYDLYVNLQRIGKDVTFKALECGHRFDENSIKEIIADAFNWLNSKIF